MLLFGSYKQKNIKIPIQCNLVIMFAGRNSPSRHNILININTLPKVIVYVNNLKKIDDSFCVNNMIVEKTRAYAL